MHLSPRGMIVLGAVLVVAGFIVPLLMVIGAVRSTFLLAFLTDRKSVV